MAFGSITTGKPNRRLAIQSAAMRNGTLWGTLQAGDEMVMVTSDRDYSEATVVLVGPPKKTFRLLVGFQEKWIMFPKDVLELFNISLRFYLGSKEEVKQCFRLEWEDRNETLDGRRVFPAGGAAHPHWQFDRWLTNSDGNRLEELRRELAAPDEEVVREFGVENEVGCAPKLGHGGRPNLSWFTKIHFPVTAKWPAFPIGAMDTEFLPHAEAPASLAQIENWIGSALCYVKDQGTKYLP